MHANCTANMAISFGPSLPTEEESQQSSLGDSQSSLALVQHLADRLIPAAAQLLNESAMAGATTDVMERVCQREDEEILTRELSITKEVNQHSVGANGTVVVANVTSKLRGVHAKDVQAATTKTETPGEPQNKQTYKNDWSAIDSGDAGDGQSKTKQELSGDEESDVDLDDAALNYQLYSRLSNDMTCHQAAMKGKGIGLSEIPTSSSAPERSDVYDGGQHRYEAHRSRDRTSIPLTPHSEEEDSKGLSFEDQLMEAEEGELGREFLPLSELWRLVCKETVETQLTKAFPSTEKATISHLADKICPGSSKSVETDRPGPDTPKSYRRVFALLALVGRLKDIAEFLDDDFGICDDDLPLRPVYREGLKRIFDLRTESEPHAHLRCFTGWRAVDRKNFYMHQWDMLAPFFDPGEKKPITNYILNSDTRLPFTFVGRSEDSDDVFRQGGFAKVYKVAIHPSHHAFDDPDNRGFAVKEVEAIDIISFKQEVDIYASFAREPHHHITNLLATFQQEDRMCMIFHWAEADLLQFWMHVKPPKELDGRFVRWMVEQCAGLAGALLRIHIYKGPKRQISGSTVSSFDAAGKPTKTAVVTVASGGAKLYGRHGDIKPRNILCFRDPNDAGLGTLKLSDFGVSEVNSSGSKSNKQKASRIPRTQSYRPPECDMHGEFVNQAFDIWTLGCLYLEFIAWLLGGYELVQSFAIKRQEPTDVENTDTPPEWFLDTFFFTYTKSGKTVAAIKSAVTKFVRRLRQESSCSLFLHEFLTMIMEHMLVVDRQKRASCRTIVAGLEAMKRKCESDPDYAVKPVSQPPQHPAPFPGSRNARYQLKFVSTRPKSGSKREETTRLASASAAQISGVRFVVEGVSRGQEREF